MEQAAFELICVLCQSLVQPAPSAAPMLLDASWLAQQQVLVVQAQTLAPAVAPTPVRRPAPSSIDAPD